MYVYVYYYSSYDRVWYWYTIILIVLMHSLLLLQYGTSTIGVHVVSSLFMNLFSIHSAHNNMPTSMYYSWTTSVL